MRRTVYVVAAGGLGNQLFQLAKAIDIANQDEVVVLLGHKSARLNPEGSAILTELQLPGNVSLRKLPESRLFHILIGVILRGQNSESFLGRALRAKIERSLSVRLLAKKWLGSKVKFVTTELQECDSNVNILLVGYFQNYVIGYQNTTMQAMGSILPAMESRELLRFNDSTSTCPWILVHFRLTDYLNETKIGTPTAFYYERAISKLWNSEKFAQIIVFSDDIEMAKKIFPKRFAEYAQFVNEIDNSAVLTFQAMRGANAYVIANSTFSWWSAFLRLNTDSPVIYPSPWFSKLPQPSGIYPEDWLEFSSY